MDQVIPVLHTVGNQTHWVMERLGNESKAGARSGISLVPRPSLHMPPRMFEKEGLVF